MKVLNWSNLPEPVTIDVIPAPITDYSKSYADDKIYSYYNTSFQLMSGVLYINILADNLVKILHFNGQYGYWVGFGINKKFFDDATEIYFGYGEPETPLSETYELPPTFQRNNGQEYYPFYLDIEAVAENGQKAYLIVVKNTIHFHFIIDTSTVAIMKAKPTLDPILWKACTVEEMRNDFLFGINLCDADGNPLPDELFVQHLNAAINWLESLLDICISERDIENERHDYYKDDYYNWGFIQTDKKPVKEITRLNMMYGNSPSVEIPLDWIQLTKILGSIKLFPQAGSANNLIIGQTGLLYGFQNRWSYAPNVWLMDYKAGIDENDKSMPIALLKEAIYKRACTNILAVWGDLIIGAGIANQSVSIDGLSQSKFNAPLCEVYYVA